MSAPEVAAALNLSESYTRRLIARGDLPVVRICRRTLIDARDVEALIERFKGTSREN